MFAREEWAIIRTRQTSRYRRCAGVKVEHVLPSGAHPLRGYGYEPVDERFHALPGLYAEPFERVNAQQPLVEIAYDGRDEHEHRVLPHLRLGQVVPSEIVVHIWSSIFCLAPR